MSAGADAVSPRRVLAPVGARTRRVVGVVALLVACDQVTKAWAASALADGPKYVIGHSIGFELTRNSGSAFSRFQGYTPILAVGAVIVTVFLVRTVRRVHDAWTVVGLALVLSGALGNLCDRIFRSPGFMRGEVVDFVKLGPWPLFNVADSCLTIGAVVLAVRMLFAPTSDADEH
ncbi:MAG TPA: signal peptidase II [Acidimicrobiia bacterium]